MYLHVYTWNKRRKTKEAERKSEGEKMYNIVITHFVLFFFFPKMIGNSKLRFVSGNKGTAFKRFFEASHDFMRLNIGVPTIIPLR